LAKTAIWKLKDLARRDVNYLMKKNVIELCVFNNENVKAGSQKKFKKEN